MKTFSCTYLLFLTLIFIASPSKAQTFKDAGEYMAFIGKQNQEIIKDYLSYTSAVAHSKNGRKIENRRKALLQTVKDGTRKIAAMPSYKGDKSYRDSTAAFLRMTYHILNDDYGKIINLEEVAEQSYDAMEAYFLAQDLANVKSDKSFEYLRLVQKTFALTHGIELREGDDSLSKKAQLASQVNAYHRVIYLIFFKSYKQEAYLLDALQKKDINAIEQNNNTLKKYAEEAIAKLDTIKAFRNDRTLVAACRQLQEFYSNECKETTALTEFLLKEENFQKLQKSFEAKKASDRTKADIDQFNQAIDDMNKSAKNYNNINTRLYASRSKHRENWNKLSQSFVDKHTPHHR